MSTTITSLGVGSGLPLQDTLDKLAKAEQESLNPITRQRTFNQSKKAAYESLRVSLQKFQTASNELSKDGLFSGTKASSSSNDITVTTSANATPGTYDITVTQLATAQVLRTKDSIGTESDKPLSDMPLTLTIKQRNGKTAEINLAASDTSPDGIRKAINNSDSGISASIIKNDAGYHFVISAEKTGSDNGISSITVSGGGDLGKTLGYNSGTDGMTESSAANDATLSVNGIKINSPTNTITDAPQGVTLTLLKKTEGTTVTVEKNIDNAKTVIKNWVDAYNSLLDTIDKVTRYVPVDPGTKTQNENNGPLLGDSTVMTIKARIREKFILRGSDATFTSLAQIGISTREFATGKLSIEGKEDEKRLNDALTNNPAAVAKLLFGDGVKTGVLRGNDNDPGINDLLTKYLASNGTINTMEQSITKRDVELQKRFLLVSAQVDARIEQYKKQFTTLDLMMKKNDDLSKYLMQQFDALSKSSK